jgi:hypothetical protein
MLKVNASGYSLLSMSNFSWDIHPLTVSERLQVFKLFVQYQRREVNIKLL